MTGLIALIISTLAGECVLWALLPRLGTIREMPGEWMQRLGLAFGVGIGITSALGFLRAVYMPAWAGGPIVCEVALAVVAGAALMYGRRRKADEALPVIPAPAMSRWDLAVIWGSIAALASVGTAWMMRGLASPHGGYDGWALWNQRSRFMYHGGSLWSRFFDPALVYWANQDYPLLMPISVARLWFYAQEATQTASLALGVAFAIATSLIVIGTVLAHRGTTAAAIAAIVMIGMPVTLDQVPYQQADIPVGCFMVGAMALLADALSSPEAGKKYGRWLLAGFFAGCAIWTKREGTLFMIASTSALFAGFALRAIPWRSLALWGAGASPMLAVMAL